MLKNIRRWHSHETRPRIPVKVSIGHEAFLSLEVAAFDAINPEYLSHVNFRSLTSQFLRTTPTQPFGLHEYRISPEALNTFFDTMLDGLIAEHAARYHHAFWKTTFQQALLLSRDDKRKDVSVCLF